jgi:hypothetical protein
LLLSRLETFAAKVQDGLQQADFQTRRDSIRALVKRVEVDEQQIRIVFRVSPTSLPSSSEDGSPNWQDGGRRVFTIPMLDAHVVDGLRHRYEYIQFYNKRNVMLELSYLGGLLDLLFFLRLMPEIQVGIHRIHVIVDILIPAAFHPPHGVEKDDGQYRR